MSILKFANLLALKYKYANKHTEEILRKQLPRLLDVMSKQYEVLSYCAKANPKGASTPNERKAVLGAAFCRKLFVFSQFLAENAKELPLEKMRSPLEHIATLIQDNINISFDDTGKVTEENADPEKVDKERQFPHVAALIFEMYPSSTKNERTFRDKAIAQARKGLSVMKGLALSMLKDLGSIEVGEGLSTEYTKGLGYNFSPQRANLQPNTIVQFIREHGPKMGINDLDAWTLAVRDDYDFREAMTTIINALNRGYYPLSSMDSVKEKMKNAFQEHQARKGNNSGAMNVIPETPNREEYNLFDNEEQ